MPCKQKTVDPSELGDQEYLRNLAERLMHVPVMYGTDQYDCDRLLELARKMVQ
jgi:hypothetical protein